MALEARDLNLEPIPQPTDKVAEPSMPTLMSLLPSDPIPDTDVHMLMPRFIRDERRPTKEDRATLPTFEQIDLYQREHRVHVVYNGPRNDDSDHVITTDSTFCMVAQGGTRGFKSPFGPVE